ncbi:MAG: [protein-PII] uridylyltransferase [Burkholderiales bacterium]|nr:[protein-PII] uridylyltransferase [Burkholderiales bacterium]
MSLQAAQLAAWRAEAQAQRQALIDAYLRQPRPHGLLRGLARVADRLLARVWQAADLPAAAALVAVGGYGRGELYPHSDVDVLILLDDGLAPAQLARFEPLIGLFWDLGLAVGHSVRSLTECLTEAGRDVTIQTNLLETRRVAGSPALYRRLRQNLRTGLDPIAFFEAKWLEQQDRHGRAEDRALRLEPNVKEHPGGLRDLHMVGWIARACGLPAGFTGLARAGLIDRTEARLLTRHARFLADLRIRLHLISGRREDRLLFELQEPLAAQLGIAARPPRRASERLMQRYYQTAREVALANEFLLAALRCRLRPPQDRAPLPDAPGFSRNDGRLDLDPQRPPAMPAALFDALLALARHPELRGPAPQLLRALWRARRAVGPAFRRDPTQRTRFLQLLREPRGVTRALRLMHKLGILGRYLPAFGRVTGQLQHDLYHVFPVDEHTLMVMRNLRRLAQPEYAHELPLAHRLMSAFDRQDLLLLAALFHDIAKGRGGDHSLLGEAEARRFCRGHGLTHEETELVAWLVREHLLLSSTAQKQDLNDPHVIESFARRCGGVRRLTALYLLTVADVRGTNPAIWNAWKDHLLRSLYLAARHRLEGGQPQLDAVEHKKEAARATLRLYGYPEGAEQALWSRLDELWFLRLTAQEIAWQTRRLLPLAGREAVVVRARLAPIGEGIEVMVYAPDQRGLFARICGFFAGLRLTVLEAKIHATRDGHALDSFLVMDPDQRGVPYRDLLSYVEHELALRISQNAPLQEVAHGRLPRQLRSFPLEPDLSLEPVESGNGYLLSFTAGDRPGLLYAVARVFERHRINVRLAKIDTEGGRAQDAFVLEGEALEHPAERLTLEQELLAVLRVPAS